MAQKKSGAIVYVSSHLALMPSPYMSVYAASKCFMVKLYESLRYEYSNTRIVFQCLNPVLCDGRSNRGDSQDEEIAKSYAESAIRTLGWSNNITGNWKYGLQVLIYH